jgi:hypothetical protein
MRGYQRQASIKHTSILMTADSGCRTLAGRYATGELQTGYTSQRESSWCRSLHQRANSVIPAEAGNHPHKPTHHGKHCALYNTPRNIRAFATPPTKTMTLPSIVQSCHLTSMLSNTTAGMQVSTIAAATVTLTNGSH